MPYGPSSPARGMTLRFRLMVWNAVVVIITAFVTLIGLREGVRWTLVHELDQLLTEDVREIELALANVGDATSPQLQQQLDRKDAGHAQHKWFVQLIDAQDKILYASEHAPPELAVPFAKSSASQTANQWRYLGRDIDGVTVRVGSSLQLIREDIGRIDRLVALAVAVVFLAAPLCGYWLAGSTTRPLNEMITTMDGLRPSRLNERLKLRGTGDELDRLSSTFNRLLDRIGSYLQERRDILANAAHELRTPLAAIRSSIEVTLNKTRSTEEYEALLTEVIEESASLELLVNQLLLLAETEAERLRVHSERVRLDELVEKAIDMFAGVAEYRDIRLLCPALPVVEVYGNRQHLRQVVYNLLDNALKFTRADGQVHVELKITDDQAVLSVRDTGIGIHAEDLPHVFDRFFQGSNRKAGAKDAKGTGLGLSICRAIVRSHEGTIHVESALNQATCLTIKLPLASKVELSRTKHVTQTHSASAR